MNSSHTLVDGGYRCFDFSSKLSLTRGQQYSFFEILQVKTLLIPVVVSLAIFTVAMAAAAYWRRMNLPAEERFAIHFKETMNSLKTEISADDKNRLDKALK